MCAGDGDRTGDLARHARAERLALDASAREFALLIDRNAIASRGWGLQQKPHCCAHTRMNADGSTLDIYTFTYTL